MNTLAVDNVSSSVNSVKFDLIVQIQDIDNLDLLQKIQNLIKNQDAKEEIKTTVSDKLYKNMDVIRKQEKVIYDSLFDFLVKTHKYETKHKIFRKKDGWRETFFDVNEPEIKNILDQSQGIKQLGLEKWLEHFYDLGERRGNRFFGSYYYLEFKKDGVINLYDDRYND